VVTFTPKGRITALVDTPVAAQRVYERVSMLSELQGKIEGDEQQQQSWFSSIRQGWEEEGSSSGQVGQQGGHVEEMVHEVMRALVGHYLIAQPGLLEPLVEQVALILNNTATCFYFFW
jgi:hypothetical protein